VIPLSNYVTEIAQLITALTVLFNCWQTWRNSIRAKKIQENVQIIEKSTNSMKDALVASTAKASLAEGHAEGLQKGRAEERK
jgi:hypothetical protein